MYDASSMQIAHGLRHLLGNVNVFLCLEWLRPHMDVTMEGVALAEAAFWKNKICHIDEQNIDTDVCTPTQRYSNGMGAEAPNDPLPTSFHDDYDAPPPPDPNSDTYMRC